jgi:alkylation response protein AidB-like acyl-CoA dehydrogenase
MGSRIDEELRMLEEMALDFAERELKDRREECDHYPYAPLEENVLEKACDVGFFCIMVPEELEGGAMGVEALSLVLKDISRTDASLAGVIFTNALAQELIIAAGAGGALAGAPGNGSWRESLIAFPAFDDPAENLGLTADGFEGSECSLTGTTEYVVLGGLASRALLPAAIPGEEGYSCFLVELGAGGVVKSEPVLSLGLHSCPAVDLVLDRARASLVGEKGAGGSYFSECADRMSIAAAAISAGIMKGSLDEALEYSQQRFQGGREIVDWSELRRILADMGTAQATADALVDCACARAEEGEPGWRMLARATALQVQAAACDVTTDGIQVLGGNGYMEDYGQEKRFRDAKQVQALLGLVPMRKLEYITRVIEGEPT